MLAPKPSLYLPPRDRDVLVRLCMGDSSEEIGQALFITAATVKTHLDGLSKRFGTHNRVGTAMAAIRAGFTPDQDQQEVST
jgi:DNA-binding NarL/FixJ family response regulator